MFNVEKYNIRAIWKKGKGQTFNLCRRLRVICRFQARLSSVPAFITHVAMCLSVFTNYGNETK